MHRSSKHAFVRAAFLGTPRDAWTWVNGEGCLRDEFGRYGGVESVLKPWSSAALRRWMEDAGFGPGSGPECARFTEATGNWGDLLHELGQRCQQSPHRWSEHLEEFAAEVCGSFRLLERFEIVPDALPVLKGMAEWDGPVTEDELGHLLEGLWSEQVGRVMRWADLLGFAHRPAGSEGWLIDPVLARAVLNAG